MDNTLIETEIQRRTEEVAGYQVNIDNYTLMIEKLPACWNERLVRFQGKEIADVAASDLSMEDMELVGDLLFHDKLVVTLMSEKLEQRKAKLILTILKGQLQ